MNGKYRGEGFGMGFGAESAFVECGDLFPEARTYTVDRSEHQVAIALPNEPKPIVVTLRSDGKLAGQGPIVVGGKVQVGTKIVWVDDPRDAADGCVRHGHNSCVPIYQPKSLTCTAGLMAATGPLATRGDAVHAGMSVLGLGQSAPTFKITPGLRLNDTYVGQSGGSVEFDEDSASVKCGANATEHSYAIEQSGGEVLVKIDSGGSALAMGADGRLTAREGVAGCTLGILSMSGTASPGAPPTRTVGAPTAPNIGVGWSGAVLSLVSGLPPPSGGKNLLEGHTFGLSKENFDAVLTKMRFHPPPNTSVIEGWAQACRNRSPVCQQGFNAEGASSVTTISMDANGNATFAAVPAGTYYVFGSARFGEGDLLWNVRVDLTPGPQLLRLDQRNAMPID
jgi:hypothetical protein